MERALALAKEAAAAGEVPVGAVIVRDSDGFIAGTGRNSREKDRNALAHAEIAAIDDACRTLGGWRLSGCTMYVTLEPCPMCAGAALNARLDRIVFGARDRRAGACGSVTDIFAAFPDSCTAVEGGSMEEECAALLKDFFREMRSRRKKFRLTPVAAADQLMRASALSGLSPDELNGGEMYFIRRNAAPIGLLLRTDGTKRMILFDGYKDTDLSEIDENI